MRSRAGDDVIPDARVRAQSRPTAWGDWFYDAATFTLVHQPNDYYVDLNACRHSAEVLDWIFQVRAKHWADAKTIADFLLALNDLLDPQHNICSMGQDKKIDPRQAAAANGYK